MHIPFNFQFIVMLGFLVFFADVAIQAGIARSWLKCICYGAIAVLSLIFVVVAW